MQEHRRTVEVDALLEAEELTSAELDLIGRRAEAFGEEVEEAVHYVDPLNIVLDIDTGEFLVIDAH